MRSTNAADYQNLPRAIGVMSKTFASGAATGWHAHKRGQVLHATAGLMLARTHAGAWTVPSGHALLIPPGLSHDIAMHGTVIMLTAYISPTSWKQCAAPECRVVRVSRLLDSALEALTQEPPLYQQRGRHLAAIILDEVKRAEVAELTLPLPETKTLKEVCSALVADPSLALDLDAWADTAALSRRSLTRKFRSETGFSFGQWRRRLRQLHTMQLTAQGAQPKDIASSVGYRSSQALHAMMRRESGSPANGSTRNRAQ